MGTLARVRKEFSQPLIFHPEIHRRVDNDAEKSLFLSWLLGRYSVNGGHLKTVDGLDCVDTSYKELLAVLFKDRSHVKRVLDSLREDGIICMPCQKRLIIHLREDFLDNTCGPVETAGVESDLHGVLELNPWTQTFRGDIDILMDEAIRVIRGREDVPELSEEVVGEMLDVLLAEKARNMCARQITYSSPEAAFQYVLNAIRHEYGGSKGLYDGLQFDYVWSRIKQYPLWGNHYRPEHTTSDNRKTRRELYNKCCSLYASLSPGFEKRFPLYMAWWEEFAQGRWKYDLKHMLGNGLQEYLSMLGEATR
jgi:hypothetical protein